MPGKTETAIGLPLDAARWFARYPDLEKPIFTLRLTLSGGYRVTIRAWEGPVTDSGHTRLFCELRQGSLQQPRVLFPREGFYVGIPRGETIDGISARESVLALFCLKPGDTDSEFFADYTEEQLSFVESFGEELSLERERRYCDENGNLRRTAR